ncbi:MAG TPA: Rid family hydrolase [Gemmatimonadaceae bacterium]|nr:Rid family hydrolase [Gemmatimonadaceae bacterium]
MIKHLPLLAIALASPLTASAQARKDVPLPTAQGVFPNISGAVWVGNTLYVSGWLDPDLETHADSKSQTLGLYTSLQTFLESQKVSLGDVVFVRAYIGTEAAHAGYSAAYNQVFSVYPNKPAHTLLEVVLPAARRGALIEVDVIVARPT